MSFEEVEWREKVETVLMSENDFRGIIEAKHKEIANLIEHKVFVEHDDVGQEYIDTRWIITEKIVDRQPVIKARLVAKGFQECLERGPTIRTDSPTGVKENLRLLLAISATNQWELRSIDIKSAYLQGNKIEREVYIKPPTEIVQNKLWKLNKAIYGLNDAARAWYLTVKTELLKM